MTELFTDLQIESPEAGGSVLIPAPLVQVLPVNFPLPALIKFVPDVGLKGAVEAATRYALSIDVQQDGGLQRADAALTVLRDALKAIEADFKDPCDVAYQLHKRLTTMRAEWTGDGEQAIKTVGKRIWSEQQRLETLAAEQRRKDQAEADKMERARAAAAAKLAAAQQAPAPIVEALQRQALTATAPPVHAALSPKLAGSTVTTRWRSRLNGTADDAADQQPKVAELTAMQLKSLRTLLQGIILGIDPITAIEINYSVLDARALSDKATFAISGCETWQDVGVRAKSRR